MKTPAFTFAELRQRAAAAQRQGMSEAEFIGSFERHNRPRASRAWHQAPHKRTFPADMPGFHRRQYARNLREIRFNSAHGINSGHVENLRNANHLLIALYVTPSFFARR